MVKALKAGDIVWHFHKGDGYSHQRTLQDMQTVTTGDRARCKMKTGWVWSDALEKPCEVEVTSIEEDGTAWVCTLGGARRCMVHERRIATDRLHCLTMRGEEIQEQIEKGRKKVEVQQIRTNFCAEMLRIETACLESHISRVEAWEVERARVWAMSFSEESVK